MKTIKNTDEIAYDDGLRDAITDLFGTETPHEDLVAQKDQQLQDLYIDWTDRQTGHFPSDATTMHETSRVLFWQV